MASSSTAAAPAILGQVVTEKLTKTNFVLWKAQVLAALRGAQLAGFLDNSIKPPSKMVVLQDKDGNTGEKVVNAAYTQWVAQEQQVLSYLLMSLSREVLTQVATLTPSIGGKPMDDEELVTYILAGLDFDYNSVVSSVANRAEPISVSELHAQLTGNGCKQSSFYAAWLRRAWCSPRGWFCAPVTSAQRAVCYLSVADAGLGAGFHHASA
ncbi:hypothetical protein OsJ_35132 [Oryza sativa Japonica Group]|uniref:Uncharacterized protein n=1 Tax=Oryza sativa subsp. japonica TaxID=39947 RepID=A3CEP7_ORYSJ|nr:hypothetical protein OsJ_35132 [Oryza sativa Japonica Group]